MGILRGARSWEYLGSLTDNLETSPTWLEMKMFSKKREYHVKIYLAQSLQKLNFKISKNLGVSFATVKEGDEWECGLPVTAWYLAKEFTF